jgi:hypothetical protein
MAKLVQLNDDQLKENLKNKLEDCNARLDSLRKELEISRRVYQNISLAPPAGLDSGLMTQHLGPSQDAALEELVIAGLELGKCLHFLHSKLCVSDPLVTSKSANMDIKNKRASEVCELFISHFKEHVELQERLEAGPYLDIVVDGNGVLFNGWDTDGGSAPIKPATADDPTIKMEGDFDVRTVPVDKFYIDAAAKHYMDAKYVFEEQDADVDQLCFKFPDKVELFQKYVTKQKEDVTQFGQTSTYDKDQEKNLSTLKIFHYWEKGLPSNGFLGAWIIFIDHKDPQVFYRGPNPFEHKQIPYDLITDIDIPSSPYGMSRIVYAIQLQQSINTLLSQIMDNIALHGSIKLAMPEGSVSADALKNSADAPITYNPASGGKIEYLRPAAVTTDVWRFYDLLKLAMENFYGMNEFSQGNIPRELSSFAVQLALEMDDKYRIRLFNKKKRFLRKIYLKGLSNAKQFVHEKRKLKIVGSEQAPKLEYYSAADLNGDYDISVDFGSYLPVDPAARKQQIIELFKSGVYEKAGGNVRKLVKLLVDGDLLDARYETDKSIEIQNAEIDRIIDGEEIGLNEWDDHESHAGAINDFCRTQFFENLGAELKAKIWEHGKAHIDELAKKMAETEANQGQGGQGQGGQQPPQGGGIGPDLSALNFGENSAEKQEQVA